MEINLWLIAWLVGWEKEGKNKLSLVKGFYNILNKTKQANSS